MSVFGDKDCQCIVNQIGDQRVMVRHCGCPGVQFVNQQGAVIAEKHFYGYEGHISENEIRRIQADIDKIQLDRIRKRQRKQIKPLSLSTVFWLIALATSMIVFGIAGIFLTAAAFLAWHLDFIGLITEISDKNKALKQSQKSRIAYVKVPATETRQAEIIPFVGKTINLNHERETRKIQS